MSDNTLIELFTARAEAVSAVVKRMPSMKEATDYVINLCGEKEACQLLISGCGEPLSEKAEDLCEVKQDKIVAGPNLSKKHYNALAKACEQNGFVCKSEGLRENLAGIDIGFTVCQGAIAETGSIVLDSDKEDTRLATMIAEIHVAAVPVDAIVQDYYAEEELLAKLIGGKTPSYTAFITGASRTADIERVLALGVHGPLELHVLLLDEV
ncbi:LutC/YkgG family protein [Oceanidesulfovibrio marinus]|uniref:Lactate utilization protein n=1 Tax=Oceanidesulfovibrio marinus TaxID=370038 RepID=A0A6P1ZIQ6_9BACT|nr:lactate utilization protein [Oceanidesulfovibrio marinus]QJT09432.1 lactate utilization protein [Oceanidesulfovibrio marinus]TVM33654.1 lactate utilization protein [Oceanidesulfovibrio marinus]